MLLIVYGGVAPILVALLLWLRFDRQLRQLAETASEGVAETDRALLTLLTPASRWDGLTEQIARHGHQRPPRRSDPALRRRHLAAVLPADARR